MIWGIEKNGRRRIAASMAGVLLLAGVLVSLFHTERFQTVSKGEELPIYSVECGDRRIAITFDAAAGASDTDALLGILAAHKVKATFFLCGCWMRNHPEETIRLYGAGHEIGNHGDKHKDPVKLGPAELEKEIEDASAELQRLVGIRPVLYRPAYGSYNKQVITTARQLGYEAVQWSVDSLDWKEQGVEAMTQQVLQHAELQGGAILLFHNDARYTAQALDQLLTELENRGYCMVTVSELLLPKPYQIDYRGRQFPLS